MSRDRHSNNHSGSWSNPFRRLTRTTHDDSLAQNPPRAYRSTSYSDRPEVVTAYTGMPGAAELWGGYMPNQMAVPPFHAVPPNTQSAQLAAQMLQMQTQMQQMQQMMQHLMTSGAPPTPATSASSETGNSLELPASQYFDRQITTLQTTITDRSKIIVCSVCATPKTFVPLGQNGASDFPRQNLTAKCNHESSICLACLASWIEAQLDSKGWNNICCPQCLNVLEHNAVQKFASDEVFQRYDQLASRAAIALLPNFRYCVRKGCESGQEHMLGASSPRMTCVSCAFEMCFTCDVAWHSGETCSEYRVRKAEIMRQEALSLEWIENNTTRCPRCRIPIEFIGGCAHLTCTCHYDWCKVCKKSWKDCSKNCRMWS